MITGKGVVHILIFFILGGAGFAAFAKEDRYALTAQALSFAPNAGGQQAYSFRVSTSSLEVGAFSNSYLLVSDRPLMGGTADYRFSVCKKHCWWEFFAQIGGGISTAGPLLEATWGAMIPLLPLWLPGPAPKYIPALRLDITTQMILIQWRGITWSYPVWAGLTIPF